MNTKYPPDKWLHIFTDGSQMDGYINTGAGIYCELFFCYIPLRQHSIAFDAEIEALRTTLRLLNLHQNKFERAVIFSDSKAAILSAGSTQNIIWTEARDCQALTRQLKAKHKQIALQWIPGHCQIAGNEHADALAEKGCQNYTNTYWRNMLPFYYTTFKTGVSECTQIWTRDKVIPKTMEARNIQNTRLAKKKGICRISIVLSAWLFGYTPSPHWNPPRPQCILCSLHEPMDRNHLGKCTALFNRTECERYWEARTKMMNNWFDSFLLLFLWLLLTTRNFIFTLMLFILF